MADEKDEIKNNNGPSKKKRAAVILLIMLLAGAVLGTRWFILSRMDVSTDDAYITGHVYQISPRITGHVKQVFVDDNQVVKKGELLVELDTADYAAALDNAASAVELAGNDTKSDMAAVGAAQADVRLAQSRLELARRNLARGDDLFKRGIIAKQDYDSLVTGAEVASSQLKNAEDAANKAKAAAGLMVKGGEDAKIAQKEAVLKQARLNLAYTKIYAPADGYVTTKSVEPGNNVQPGQPLMAVVQLDDAWVTANYKESQLTYVRPGQKVEFEVDAYPGHKFRGTVQSIMAGTGAAFSLLPPENATGNFVKIVQRIPVKITIDRASDPGHLLRVGMSVVPTIYTGRSALNTLREIFN